jgi:hypothetical protein
MSENNESVGTTLKNTIIGVVVTIITAVGGIVTTQFEKIFGGESTQQEAPASPQIIINNTQQGGSGGTVRERVVERPIIVPIQTAPAETVKVEEKKPSSRDRLLNRNRD